MFDSHFTTRFVFIVVYGVQFMYVDKFAKEVDKVADEETDKVVEEVAKGTLVIVVTQVKLSLVGHIIG